MILSLTSPTGGRQLKVSEKVFHSLRSYRRLPVEEVPPAVSQGARKVGLLRTFVGKPIGGVHTSGFVIASQDEEILRILDSVRPGRALSSLDPLYSVLANTHL